jgi:hypothetical protein
MEFPFNQREHRLIIGESWNLVGKVQYHSVKYDCKPVYLDREKEGIIETNDAKACTIRLPLVEEASKAKKPSTVFKGKVDEAKTNENNKDCILIIDHLNKSITLERISSQINVRDTRMCAENTEFKQVKRGHKRKLDPPALPPHSQRTQSGSTAQTGIRPAPASAMSRESSESITTHRDDIVLPTKVKSAPVENIIGLGSSPPANQATFAQEKSTVAPVESIFSPDSDSSGNNSSSSSGSSSDSESDSNPDPPQDNSDAPSDDDVTPQSKPNANNLLDDLGLSTDSDSDSDSD